MRQNELDRVRTILNAFVCCFVSAMNDAWHDEMIIGRPYGGLAIFWRKILVQNVPCFFANYWQHLRLLSFN